MSTDNAGTNGAEKAVSESAAAEKAVSLEGSAKPSAEVQKRIDELTGELGRKNAKLEKFEQDLAAEREKNKSEQEKRADALVEQRTGPQLKRLAKIEAGLKAEFDQVMASIPDSAKAAVIQGDNIPIEQRLSQARAVLSLIGTTKGQPFTAGANASSETKRTITKDQFLAWQNLPGQRKFKEYDELKDEMNNAYREGRIIGI